MLRATEAPRKGEACGGARRGTLYAKPNGGDGMQQKTFWMHREQQEYPILRGRHSADAAVVGGGLTGLMTALWLSRAGLRVALVEAVRLGSGASGCCAGVASLCGGLRYARVEKQLGAGAAGAYAQTLSGAFRALRELAREQGPSSGWRDADVRLVTEKDGGMRLLEREAQAMMRAGVAATVGAPSLCPLPAAAALTVKDMGMLNPARFLRYLAAQAARNGVKIYESSRATSLETNMVHTERGSIQAPYIMIATGYPIVNTPGWYFLRMQQRQGWLMPLEATARFEGIYLDADGRYALRNLHNGALFQLNGGPVGARENRSALETFRRTYAPALGCGEPAGVYGGAECVTADGLPFIGPYSRKTPNLFVAGGYGGQGLIGAMLAAQIISARVLGLPGEGYDLYCGQRGGVTPRFLLGLAGRYAGGLAARHWAPRCPHMGCRLVYDAQARIWECPCHGSRFDDIGRVLSGPAVHDAQVRRGNGR